MQGQESAVEENTEQKKQIKPKQNKKLKNSETWSLEKKIFYFSMMSFFQTHDNKCPKNFHLCVDGQWVGRDLAVEYQ